MRILVVEDEHKIAHALKKGLEQESYAVDIAYDGKEGYDLASSESYDVIVLDVMLPYHDGFEVCTMLRKQGIRTPVLMLTAKGQTIDKVTGLNAEADDYLTKPFAFEELIARIRALLRRPRSLSPSVLTLDNLTIDTNTYRVKRGTTPISLTPKEYSLLEYLMRNVNRIVPKEDIISHVWNFDADILPNTVEVYIGYIRSKVDKPFPDRPSLICTVRGFGYKIGV